LDWVSELDRYFKSEEVREDWSVKFIAIKLKGHAALWWDSVQAKRRRMNKLPIKKWSRMVATKLSVLPLLMINLQHFPCDLQTVWNNTFLWVCSAISLASFSNNLFRTKASLISGTFSTSLGGASASPGYATNVPLWPACSASGHSKDLCPHLWHI